MQVKPPRLRYRVMNRVWETGAVGSTVIADLPTMHQGRWKNSSAPLGAPGSSMVASFTIPLYPVGSKSYYKFKPIYDLLAEGMRVEAYLGPPGGAMWSAGVITRLPKSRSGFSIEGKTDPYVAQLTPTFPGETMQATALGVGPTLPVGSTLLDQYLGTEELAFGDDCNPYNAAAYTSTHLGIAGGATGTWAPGADPITGLSCMINSTGKFAINLNSAALTFNDPNWFAMARCYATIVPGTDGVGANVNARQYGAAGLVLGSDGSNCILVQVYLNWNAGAGAFDVIGNFTNYTGGGATGVQTTVTLWTAATGIAPLSLGLGTPFPVIFNVYFSTNEVAVTINGTSLLAAASVGNVGNQNPFSFSPLHIGAFASPGDGAAAGTSYITNLEWRTRKNVNDAIPSAFAHGSSYTVNATPLNYISPPAKVGATFLDLWSTAQELTGWQIQYIPQPMALGSRTLGAVNFGPASMYLTNTQARGGPHVFSEDVDLLDVVQDVASDGFVTETTVLDATSAGSGGTAEFSDIAAMRVHGILSDQIPSLTGKDIHGLVNAAIGITTTAANATASQVVVDWIPGKSDQILVLDTIIVNAPSWNITGEPFTVVAIEIDETKPTATLTLTTFPFSDPAIVAMRKFHGLDRMAGLFANR